MQQLRQLIWNMAYNKRQGGFSELMQSRKMQHADPLNYSPRKYGLPAESHFSA